MLNVYHVEDGERHHCIAESEEDCCQLLLESGMWPDRTDDYTIELVPLDRIITITDVDEPGMPKTAHTAAEWIALEGRCLLSSSVF